MLKTVRAFALILALLIALPVVSFADDNDHPRKYGVEILFGGGYYDMSDVNEYVAHAKLAGQDPDKIHIGTQIGLGFIYRHTENFGWLFGYNKLFAGVPVVLEDNYNLEYTVPGRSNLSTVEQKVSGNEWYALATWYCSWGPRELMFGIGPALYSASLDRSGVLSDPEPNAIPGANFSDAKGKSMGLLTMIGVEFPLGAKTGLGLQFGGRIARIAKLTYEDRDDPTQETVVPLNSYSNASLPVDFSGGFVRLTIRTYFQPTPDWRSPTR